jgi:hypothetical protein
MSWFTKKLRQYVPATRGKSYDIKTGINSLTSSVAGIFDEKHRETLTAGLDIFSSGVREVGNITGDLTSPEGNLFTRTERFLHSMEDVPFMFGDKALDRMIPDKYQDVFKGTPNIGIPNIPMPGHGAIKYLNERTQQLRFVQSKAEMLNAYGNEGIMKGGRFGGDIVDRYKGNPALLLAGPYGLVFASYQTAAKNFMNKGKGGGSVTEEATPKPAKIVKGSGSLLGKSARFSMATSGRNQGRSSLKIGRKGTGGGKGASHFKSYKSGRRSEY